VADTGSETLHGQELVSFLPSEALLSEEVVELVVVSIGDNHGEVSLLPPHFEFGQQS
jgi:hypothetical protein